MSLHGRTRITIQALDNYEPLHFNNFSDSSRRVRPLIVHSRVRTPSGVTSLFVVQPEMVIQQSRENPQEEANEIAEL